MLIPHPHQEKAVDSLFKYFETYTDNCVGVAPVAAGKSLIMAEFMRRACLKYPLTNFIVLSHVATLLVQNNNELKGQWPDVHTSFYSDQLKKKDLTGKVIFGGIQSIHNKAYDIPHRIDIAIIDEGHLVSEDEGSMYRRFLADMVKLNPYFKVIVLTGSPWSVKGGYIHQGKNAICQGVAFNISMTELIANGYLCPLVTPPMGAKMDVSAVKQRGGDFIPGELQAAVDKDEITEQCVQEMLRLGPDRKKWLIFTTGKAHARHTMECLIKHGVSTALIDGDTSDKQRTDIFTDYQKGDLRAIVNIGCLTTGINLPCIDLIGMMCPTRSPVKYTQSGGRGMRLYPGKTDCLFLDFGGVVESLGPIDKIRVKEPKLKKGEAPTKVCPECLTLHYSGVLKCECGYEFPPFTSSSLSSNASNAAILSTQQRGLSVDAVSYQKYQKVGKPPSLKVTYKCGTPEYHEWVLLEYTGYNRDKAVRWWAAHGELPVPDTVDEALKRQSELKKPVEILVAKSGKYHEITNRKFSA